MPEDQSSRRERGGQFGRGEQGSRRARGGGRPERAGGPERRGEGGRGDGARDGGQGRSGGRSSQGAPDRGGRRDGGGSPGGQGGHAPRGGRDRRPGQSTAPDQRGGARLTPRSPRLPEPAIPEGITGFELDRSVKNQLRTLSKENAVGVGQHLVMVAMLIDTDIVGAQAHAETAVRRAGRVPAAREALGLVAYRKGDWALALSEFRTARRLSGSSHMLPLMVDAERGLGRTERALDLASSPEAKTLSLDERIELAIVVSGIRRDLGQNEAAVVGLQIPELRAGSSKPWAARLYYAYAEALLACGREDEARTWFAHAVDADGAGDTDADERLAELDGVVMTDLLEGEDADEQPDDGSDRARG
jgi:hypothetical protein